MIWLPATRYDLDTLARFMRASDVWELRFNAEATGRMTEGWNIADELHGQFHSFPHWALWCRAGLVGLAGVAPLPQNPAIGAIWFLGTDLADTRWHGMTRAARRFIDMERPHWFAMGNIVPRRMTKRRKWLETLGFDFRDAEAHQNFKEHVAFWSQS